MPAGFDAVHCVRVNPVKGRGPHGVLRSPLREGETLLRSLDRQIDALVYDLYLPAPRLRQAGALTPGEIKIVEGLNS
jgi:hypothetical protein